MATNFEFNDVESDDETFNPAPAVESEEEDADNEPDTELNQSRTSDVGAARQAAQEDDDDDGGDDQTVQRTASREQSRRQSGAEDDEGEADGQEDANGEADAAGEDDEEGDKGRAGEEEDEDEEDEDEEDEDDAVVSFNYLDVLEPAYAWHEGLLQILELISSRAVHVNDTRGMRACSSSM